MMADGTNTSAPARNRAFAARLRGYAADLLAAPLVLLAPFAAFVRHNEYPLASPEVLACAVGLGAVGVAVGALAALGGTAVRVAITAALLVVFVDLQFEVLAAWDRAAAAVFAGAVGVSWLLRAHLSGVVAVVFGTILASTLLLPAGRPLVDDTAWGERPPAELPVVLHLILDEQIGVEGIPAEFDPDGEVRERLRRFYRERGFRLFGRAYSRYWSTYNALSNLFNFTALEVDSGHFRPRWFREGALLEENRYLERLAARGHAIHVYQSDYLDLCRTASAVVARRCFTYPIKKIGGLAAAPLPTLAKAELVAGSWASLSFLRRELVKAWSAARAWLARRGLRGLPAWRPREIRFTALASMAVLDRLAADLDAARPGDVFVAHVLLPHHPYVWDERCALRRPAREWLGAWAPEAYPFHNTADTRARRYPLYLAQVECVHRRLGALLDRLDAAGRLDGMLVIVHGDHGSRLEVTPPRARWAEIFSSADEADAFSTLFAVRAPGVQSAADDRILPLEVLLAAAVEGRVPGAEVAPEPEVFLAAGMGRPMMRRRLTVFTSPAGAW